MKLGLIAMSGVRCHNKELMDYGLTLPGFSGVVASLLFVPLESPVTIGRSSPGGSRSAAWERGGA